MEYKAIIFNTEIEAKEWDYSHNQFTGDVTKYRFDRKPLIATTTLTKAEYAELLNIPATIDDGEGNQIDNPAYTELENSYTLNKYALIVDDYFGEEDYACPICGEPVEVVEITNEEIYEGQE